MFHRVPIVVRTRPIACQLQFSRFNSSIKDSVKKAAHDAKETLQEQTGNFAQKAKEGAETIASQFKQEKNINSTVLQKYKDQLLKKAKELGVSNIDELREKYKDQIEKVRSELGAVDPLETIKKWEQEQEKEKSDGSVINVRSPRDKTAEKAPYKKLDDYIDVEKVKPLPRDQIELIWKTRFQNDPRSLHAVINNQQFEEITQNASEYPFFLLPLPKTNEKDEHKGYQLEFVQWSFVGANTIHCLFTSLAEYKLHGEFAKPHVVLSFHQDLKNDKDIVLMNGLNEKDGGLTTQEAQLLVLNLQRFYNGKDQKRLALVKDFNTGSENFSVDKLISEATTV